MATVYLADDKHYRKVAIKVLPFEEIRERLGTGK